MQGNKRALGNSGGDQSNLVQYSSEVQKLKNIRSSIIKISKLKDPVNVILKKWTRPNGLKIKRVTIPIGVIASFQKEIAKMGYKFQFITLAGFHTSKYCTCN